MKETVNLLPREIRQPAGRPGRLVWLAALVVIAAVAVAGWKRWEQYAADREKVRLAAVRDAVQAEIAKINAEIAPFRQAAEIQRGEAAALSTLRERVGGRMRFSAVLGEVGRLAPPSLWLSSLESKPSDGDGAQAVDLKGAAYAHENVTAFVSSLERSRLFSNVTLVYAERGAERGRSTVKDEPGGVGFHISARMIRSPPGTRG